MTHTLWLRFLFDWCYRFLSSPCPLSKTTCKVVMKWLNVSLSLGDSDFSYIFLLCYYILYDHEGSLRYILWIKVGGGNLRVGLIPNKMAKWLNFCHSILVYLLTSKSLRRILRWFDITKWRSLRGVPEKLTSVNVEIQRVAEKVINNFKRISKFLLWVSGSKTLFCTC